MKDRDSEAGEIDWRIRDSKTQEERAEERKGGG